MISSVGYEMLSTWESAGSLNAATLKRSWKVVTVMCVLFSAVVIGAFFASHADAEAEKIKPEEGFLAKASFALGDTASVRLRRKRGDTGKGRGSQNRRITHLKDLKNSDKQTKKGFSAGILEDFPLFPLEVTFQTFLSL